MYDEGQGEGESESEDEGEDDDEPESESGNESKIRRNVSRNGRVYISNPRSPGPRAPSNSMEINRDFMYRRELYDAMQETQTGSQTGTGTMSQSGGTQPGDNTSRA